MAILETVHSVDVSTVQNWLAQHPGGISLQLQLPKTTMPAVEDTATLLSALTLQCSKLQTLQLPGNRIGDQGARLLHCNLNQV
ncbi:unnamed protein product [Symbiodinium pilosum]|uniref:Uncharacterized protein n=1 Tax=Symbiodinium pilosum TaxID=2952 RepID=A0A812SP83_SYMPI|nr:unnamed protein product [Symbiodinium pilosum]